MKLEPLYRIRFTYPEGWAVDVPGGEQHLYLAEGRCEGSVSGRFRGANFPRRRADGTFLPDFRAVIDTDDGATIMLEWHGYGRAYPVGRRQIVGTVFHLSDDERYSRLNDVVCVSVGEVRASTDPDQRTELVADIAELIWEPIAD
jgi:sugar lactone lactonase YvrE